MSRVEEPGYAGRPYQQRKPVVYKLSHLVAHPQVRSEVVMVADAMAMADALERALPDIPEFNKIATEEVGGGLF